MRTYKFPGRFEKITAFLFLLAFLCSVNLSATQSNTPGATLSGYVIDAETEETLLSATVVIKGTRHGALTNKSGFFVINDIPPGAYTLVASYLGYEKFEQKITLKSLESRQMTIALKVAPIESEGVTVEAERDVEQREITISKVDVPMEQLKQLRIGGEPDVFRALQSLPGILTSSQISSGLYIRGGSPDQNLVLLDGSTVYNPTHLFGFFSTFNPESIKNVELIKGGYPAEYGSRLSAVLNLTQKDGNRNEFQGLASLGLVSSRLSLQGPINTPISEGSWFLGGRRTYLELIKGLVDEDPAEPLPDFAFYDFNGKISQILSPSDRVFLSGFLSSDDLDFNGAGIDFSVGIENRTGAFRWTHIFGDNLFAVVNLSTSFYKNGFIGNNAGFAFEAENRITDYTAKANAEWFTSDDLTLKGGFESTRYHFQYFQNFSGELDSDVEEGSTERGATNLNVYDWTHSVYGQANYFFTDLLSGQIGLRGMYFDERGIGKLEPRLALRYQFQENVAFKLSWGVYHQYLRLASLPDFSFFDTWLPTDSSVVPSRALHYIASIETSPFDGYDLNFDAYYKPLDHISELNRFANDAQNVSEIFYDGTGEAYGFEVFLQKKSGRLTGWIGYALGFIEARFDSINGGDVFRPKYDRRHDIKLVGNYKLSDRWQVGATFVFQTGQSYTGATSRFQSNFPGENVGTGVTVPSQRFGLRLPPSHQLNLNVTYNTTFFGLPARLLIDVYNVYSRRDIWFRFFDTTEEVVEVTDVRLLPIIPTAAFELEF